jgi:DNA-binding transcriptional LysR family regulator
MLFTCIMHARHMASVDLNLLLALDALLTERHVTRAAERVGITQPAMSRSLQRLRALFGDPLLVRTAQGMIPTPRAEALAAPLDRVLDEIAGWVRDKATFDPAQAVRRFRIASADYGEVVVLPPLLQRISVEAPGIDVAIVPLPQDLGAALAAGEIDLVLGPPRKDTALAVVWTPLFQEGFVTVVRRDHPLVGERLTLQQFVSLPQISVSPEGRPGNVLDDALAERGLSRRVVLRVPNFLVPPLLLAESDLVLTTAERIARRFAALLPLRLLPTPLPLPRFTLAMGWHEHRRADAAHVWLRRLVSDVGAELKGRAKTASAPSEGAEPEGARRGARTRSRLQQARKG